ncbi:MAG: ImmA/IrrE family metallo-endopeptidase [Clostridia bacterium]|nr:ImmA/IrrE family metallo-endopeptidase [Clostridia bacterium]
MTILETLYEQARADGIAVEHFPLPETVSVCVLVEGKRYIGIDRTQLETSYEEAECLAHELGHCRTDTLYALGEKNRKKSEQRATEWAILRLIPYRRFQKALKNGCREVWEFAEELGISYRFAEKVIAYYANPTHRLTQS